MFKTAKELKVQADDVLRLSKVGERLLIDREKSTVRDGRPAAASNFDVVHAMLETERTLTGSIGRSGVVMRVEGFEDEYNRIVLARGSFVFPEGTVRLRVGWDEPVFKPTLPDIGRAIGRRIGWLV